MIEITHVKLENSLVFGDGLVRVLVIENPTEFFRTVSELIRQLQGGEGDFSFFEDGKNISGAKKGEIITDLFCMEINDKKITNLLYKNLENTFTHGEIADEFSLVTSDSEKLLEKISFLSPIPIEYDSVGFSDLLKLNSVRVKEEGKGLLEKVLTYITAMARLKNVSFMIFVNLKAVFSDEDLQLLYDQCGNEKVALLLIESSLTRSLGAREEATVITDDLCEIIVKTTNK